AALRESLREILHAPPAWLTCLSREDQRTLIDILKRANESIREEALSGVRDSERDEPQSRKVAKEG
ncbi:MAG TPA: hypothetical protein VMF89_12385, partial [Polyangiales bacterium]|nr:hypothetical protein [Polyangiales bacterium]